MLTEFPHSGRSRPWAKEGAGGRVRFWFTCPDGFVISSFTQNKGEGVRPPELLHLIHHCLNHNHAGMLCKNALLPTFTQHS